MPLHRGDRRAHLRHVFRGRRSWARSWRARGEAARADARHRQNNDDDTAKGAYAIADEFAFVADELDAFARDAKPIRTAPGARGAATLGIYLWEGKADPYPREHNPWKIAVMSLQGTHHFNDFKTRDEALLYIATLRPNWPDLPVIEVTN